MYHQFGDETNNDNWLKISYYLARFVEFKAFKKIKHHIDLYQSRCSGKLIFADHQTTFINKSQSLTGIVYQKLNAISPDNSFSLLTHTRVD